jgi:D-alanyl-D-alanine carboxypeptidase
LVLVAACVALSAPAAASADAFDDVQASLDAMVEADGGPPGASALIQMGERVRFLRSGVADLRNDRAFHRRDFMRIASVSKAYSGTVALSLADQGLIDLDDTLGELLPAIAPAAWSQVTVAQLMQHTSGVPSYTTSRQFLDDFGSDPLRYFSPEELVGYVAGEPLLFEPGSAYRYSNTDNILIGLIAESITGHVYANDLRQLVYRPLRVKQTSLPDDQVMPRRYIHGYAFSPDEPPEDVSQALSTSGVWASGGIVSTPADLNSFIRGYAGGELFGADARKRQFRFVPGCGEPPGPGECSSGLSIYRYRTECGTVFGHSGNFPGYTQLTAATKNGKRSFVVSANTQIEEQLDADMFELFNAVNEAAICAVRSRK